MGAPGTVFVDDLIDGQRLAGRNFFVLGLLLIALLCDGFDLQLLAFAAPRLAAQWGIPAASLGYVITANLLGMMIGAMFLGNLGDRVGRKRVIVVGTVLYALMSLGCLFAADRLQLGILRFVTGLGLGGVLPNVIALTAEISPRAKRPMLTSIPIIGISLGSGLPAVVAAWLVPIYGWEALFVVGGIVPIAVALLIAIALPESILFLTYRGKHRDEVARRAQQLDPSLSVTAATRFALRGREERQSQGSFRDLFQGPLKVTTPLLWVMFACSLLSTHFLNSWMSVILNQAGLPEVQTAFINGALHWGGTAAAVVTVFVLGRLGLAWVAILLACGLAGVLTIATQGFASATLVAIAVCVAGFGIVGCQGVLNTAAGLIYPVSCRPTGAGAALGVGRIGSLSGPIVGGYFLARQLETQHMFYVPVLPLSIALIATAILLVRRVDIRSRDGISPH